VTVAGLLTLMIGYYKGG